MARYVAETRLQDRAARGRLQVQREPYWRSLSDGAHVGYYRGTHRGSWVARLRVGDRYLKKRLGVADDGEDADGTRVLSWRQAVEAAVEWFKQQPSILDGEVSRVEVPLPRVADDEASAASDAGGPDVERTVKDAIVAYIAMRDIRASKRAGREVKSDAHRLNRNIGSHSLAVIKLQELTEQDLKAWLESISEKKQSGRQRLVNDFKAALNSWYEDNRRYLSLRFSESVKRGLKLQEDELDSSESIARDNQILTDQQVRSIIAAAAKIDADGDILRMVIVLAATGARFSQVQRMLVRDVQAGHSRLLIPVSRKGRGKGAAHTRVRVGHDVIAALTPAIEGRPPDAALLERWRHVQVSATNWERSQRGPWTSASELRRPWNKVLNETSLVNFVPYALRHSSIVRGIRSGLPIRLVAALHDTSVAMIERHYSRWITEGLEEMAAKAVIPLVGKRRKDASTSIITARCQARKGSDV